MIAYHMSEHYTSRPEIIATQNLRTSPRRSADPGRMRLVVRLMIVFLSLGVMVLGICGLAA